jgi:hypothetical protein
LLREFGQAEVENLHVAIATQHDVFRLDVSMDNSVMMRCGQRAADLNCDVQRLGKAQWPTFHTLAKRFTIDELSGDEIPILDLTDLRMVRIFDD